MFRGISRLVLGGWSRWALVAAWVLLAVVLAPVSAGLEDETQNDTQSLLPKDAQSGEVARLLNARFESGETAVALLVYRTRGDDPLTAGQRRAIAADARRAREIPLVVDRDVRAPFGPGAEYGLVSPDGRTAFTVAPVTTTDRKAVPDTIAELRASRAGAAWTTASPGPRRWRPTTRRRWSRPTSCCSSSPRCWSSRSCSPSTARR